MSRRIVVAGTDTEIGKSVFSAGLADLLGANYWKPIQAGLGGETDSQLVARLGGLSDNRIVPERYRLKRPLHPISDSPRRRTNCSRHACEADTRAYSIGHMSYIIESAGDRLLFAMSGGRPALPC
jgi:dethiobiotin synthetase